MKHVFFLGAVNHPVVILALKSQNERNFLLKLESGGTRDGMETTGCVFRWFIDIFLL